MPGWHQDKVLPSQEAGDCPLREISETPGSHLSVLQIRCGQHPLGSVAYPFTYPLPHLLAHSANTEYLLCAPEGAKRVEDETDQITPPPPPRGQETHMEGGETVCKQDPGDYEILISATQEIKRDDII